MKIIIPCKAHGWNAAGLFPFLECMYTKHKMQQMQSSVDFKERMKQLKWSKVKPNI